MSEYTEKANDFAKKYGVKLTSRYVGFEPNEAWGDRDSMHHWKCRLSCSNSSYTFSYWMGVGCGCRKPTMYDVLACITKYDPGDFDEFCREYGYDSEPLSTYPKAQKIWKACVKEYTAVKRLFSQEAIEELYEIA